MRYRRIAMDVEAVQFDATLPKEQWPPGVEEHGNHWSEKNKAGPRNFGFSGTQGSGSGRIRHGDWIVTNIPTGEKYVVLKESFAASYMLVTG